MELATPHIVESGGELGLCHPPILPAPAMVRVPPVPGHKHQSTIHGKVIYRACPVMLAVIQDGILVPIDASAITGNRRTASLMFTRAFSAGVFFDRLRRRSMI
jgi:hypothetical protein